MLKHKEGAPGQTGKGDHNVRPQREMTNQMNAVSKKMKCSLNIY